MVADTMKAAIRNLRRKKVRSLLTISGIAIGVTSVVLIASIGEIGKFMISEELNSFGIGGILLSSDTSATNAALDARHLDAIRSSSFVDSAAPIVVDYTKSYMRKRKMDVVVWGTDAGAGQVIDMELLHGRLISKNDVSAKRQVCVVDQETAQAYYKRENIVGKTLTLQFNGRAQDFEVVGVVASGGALMQGLIGNFIPSFVYLPYSTLQEMSGKQGFDQIAISVKDGVDIDIAGRQLVSVCNQISNVQIGFHAENMENQTSKLDKVMDIVTAALSVIAGVSLLVAGLSIMTVMLVSVRERTREIGIKKSIGASQKHILREFLEEALVISVVGSIAGVICGLALLAAGCLILGLPLCINVKLVVICVVFSIFVGVIFGVYPASVASRLHPVDALRCE